MATTKKMLQAKKKKKYSKLNKAQLCGRKHSFYLK